MDFKTETQYRQEISVVWGVIDQLKAENATLKEQLASSQAENAALKEQVAQREIEYNGCSAMLNNAERTVETLEETIAQHAEVIEQMREAFRVASMDTETINRKAPEIAKGCCSMPMPDTEGMYHLANEEVCNVVSSYLYWLHKNQPTALQPSPEILDARDKRVAEACARIAHLLDQANETIAQQSATIRVAAELMHEVENKYFSMLKEKDIEAEKLKAEGDMYGWNFHVGMRSGAAETHLTMTNLIKALAIQPSPEILQARDERVAEACALMCHHEAHVMNAHGDSGVDGANWCGSQIRNGEWKEYL